MQTAVITGATSGIGLAAAKELLAGGFRVIGIGRTPASCTAALDGLEASWKASAIFLAGDLMQQREVLRLAADIRERLEQLNEGRLDVLINNAGCVRSWYATSEDGYEQQFALNHLAGFLMSHELMQQLVKGRGRILFTGSGSHQGIDVNWDDIMFSRHYNPLKVYKQSKLCNMLTALELNSRFGQAGVRAFVVDPGLVRTEIGCKQTGGLVSLVWSLRKRQGVAPEVPARTFAYLSDPDNKPSGLYFYNSKPRAYSRFVSDDRARRLYALSEVLCGVRQEMAR